MKLSKKKDNGKSRLEASTDVQAMRKKFHQVTSIHKLSKCFHHDVLVHVVKMYQRFVCTFILGHDQWFCRMLWTVHDYFVCCRRRCTISRHWTPCSTSARSPCSSRSSLWCTRRKHSSSSDEKQPLNRKWINSCQTSTPAFMGTWLLLLKAADNCSLYIFSTTLYCNAFATIYNK